MVLLMMRCISQLLLQQEYLFSLNKHFNMSLSNLLIDSLHDLLLNVILFSFKTLKVRHLRSFFFLLLFSAYMQLDEEDFNDEQNSVARLIHMLYNDDPEEMLKVSGWGWYHEGFDVFLDANVT